MLKGYETAECEDEGQSRTHLVGVEGEDSVQILHQLLESGSMGWDSVPAVFHHHVPGKVRRGVRLSRTLIGFVCPSDLRLELTRELFKFFLMKNIQRWKAETLHSIFFDFYRSLNCHIFYSVLWEIYSTEELRIRVVCCLFCLKKYWLSIS